VKHGYYNPFQANRKRQKASGALTWSAHSTIIDLMSKHDLHRRHDLRRRLRRLGVVKGIQDLEAPSARRRVAIESLVEGDFHETPRGQCFVAQKSLPPTYHHGDLPLEAFLSLRPQIAAAIADEPGLAQIDLQGALFLDTETTGLSAGTGTMAFLVGLGFFQDDQFHLWQVFLRDPGDEPAMIHLLADLLPGFEALVTFNGRGFDVPILETRFILDRRSFPLTATPHLDLLGPARRLWRMRLKSCALGALEREVLGLQRDQADVPSGIIPTIYRDYLRTGDAREISRVLYHNQVDVLSMVTLAARLGRAFADPWEDAALTEADFYALSRWYEERERTEQALRRALAGNLPPELRQRALRDLALIFRRADRRDRAFEWWQQLAVEDPGGVLAPVELAKTFEWHIVRLDLAIEWTQLALARAERWPPGPDRQRQLAELRHRLERLERKAGTSVI
jgi:uncharacterized protein YprB with RNaseH-like and TPR domain